MEIPGDHTHACIVRFWFEPRSDGSTMRFSWQRNCYKC